MKGIFHPDKWNDWDTPLPNVQEIRKLDPEEDKYYLEYIIQHAYGSRQKVLMKKLGFSELPERRVNPREPEDDQYEEYQVLRDKGEVCGVPVLVFKGNAGGSAGGRTAETAGDPPGWTSDVMLNWAGTPFGQEVSAVHSWAVLGAAGFKTYFIFLNNNNYGMKWLDCLDLQMLMTDSDFINDVCMACNAGDELPHIFPADSTVWKGR